MNIIRGKQSMKYLLVIALSVIFISCNSTKNDVNTSYSQIGGIRDVSYSTVKRYVVEIRIPIGRKKEDVTATLKRAAKEIGEKINFDALAVHAYTRYDDSQEDLPIGYAEYAPNGKWEDADLTSQKLIQVHLGNAYFPKAKTDLPEINGIAYLKSKDGEKIPLSRERDSWDDEDIITKFRPGTKVKILDKYYFGTQDYIFIRYFISINNLKGWVHSWDLSINKH